MTRKFILLAALLLAFQVLILLVFGQPVIAASGRILLWVGDPLSLENSQHLADWYTLSHIIHGILFYWLIGKFFPKLSIGTRLVAALGIEVGWELLENTPMIIQHYREQALAVGYAGDSVINSLSDSVAMIVGFFMARNLRIWMSVVLVLSLEVMALYFIRDNLTLNIINLVHPFEFISNWQLGI